MYSLEVLDADGVSSRVAVASPRASPGTAQAFPAQLAASEMWTVGVQRLFVAAMPGCSAITARVG